MINYLNKTIALLINLFFFSVNIIIAAQDQISIFDKMSYQETLEISIKADLEALSDKRNDKKEKATLSFVDATGVENVWEIKLSIRGKFRRMRCEKLLPLKIHFDKDDLREAGLAKFDDLKLVNQCVEDDEIGKELLLKEYLAYELYNNITEESFRVQFLNITYIDSKTDKKVIQPGFIIEDAAQLRERVGANKVEQERGFTAGQFDQLQFQTMSLFQYWIGNSDWSFTFGRNIKVLEKGGRLIAIPYDFDFSGMVDAPYAIPNTNYGLTSLKERAYLGFATEVSQLEAAIDRFVSLKPVFKKVVKKNKLLNWKSRTETWNYLSGYFIDPMEIKFGIFVKNQVGLEDEVAKHTRALK
jgi:hypothetical protein